MQHVYSNIWQHQTTEADQIFFYFDSDTLIIYPRDQSCGFKDVFSRIHISNLYSPHGGSFFKSYTIKSLKQKNAVLYSPKSIKDFIEELKMLIDL